MKNNHENIILNDEQAIDSIYAELGNAFPDKNIKREPLQMQQIGQFGIVNPGPKNIHTALQKLDREIRSKSDAENKVPMGDIIDRDYAHREGELFDNLSDWSRFGIIIPSYKAAPAIIATFLAEFGGKPAFHEREGYQAIHIHTSYKGVNIEFQFHTTKHAELKKATDIFYHEYNNIVIPKGSRIEKEKNTIEEKINKYCQMVYSRSDFIESLPAMKEITDEYKKRHAKVPHKKLTHFLEYVTKAHMVQEEVNEKLQSLLQNLNIVITEDKNNEQSL